MRLVIGVQEAQVVVEVAGDLDSAGARLLRRALDREGPTPSRILVDITDVPFVDSAGIAALIGLARRARERGTDVEIRGARRSVARVLALTGVDQFVPVAAAPDGALPAGAR